MTADEWAAWADGDIDAALDALDTQDLLLTNLANAQARRHRLASTLIGANS